MTKLLGLAVFLSGCVGTGFVEVEIAPQAVELPAFSHLQLHAHGLRADGSREDITDLVRWTSTDHQVATIDESGTAAWAAAGTTHVRVIFYDLTATTTLTAGDAVAALR